MDGAEAYFLPSRDLPSLRTPTLGIQEAHRAIQQLRIAFGIDVNHGRVLTFEATKHRGRTVWEFQDAQERHVEGETVQPAAAHSEQDEEEDEGGKMTPEEEFENRVARTWLQRLISGRVELLEEDSEDQDATNVDQEALLTAAAEMLSLMAGKAASGPSDTTYRFLLDSKVQEDPKEISIKLTDGTLVEDALGTRTWGAAPLLSLEMLSSWKSQREASPSSPDRASCTQILELGAGTGLVGLALARDLHKSKRPYEVCLTDHHPNVLRNLERNIAAQEWLHPETSGCIRCGKLDWYMVHREINGERSADVEYSSHATTAQSLPAGNSDKDDAFGLDEASFHHIIAADCVYDPIHPIWIRSVAEKFLVPSTTRNRGLLHILSPLRSTHTREIEALCRAFPRASRDVTGNKRLVTLQEMQMDGVDDFSGVRWRAPRQNMSVVGGRYKYMYLKIGWSE